MKDSLKNYYQLIRGNELLFLIILMGIMDLYVARPVLLHQGIGGHMPWYALLLLIIGSVTIAAAGRVINDYFDVKIDAINRPDDLIVTRAISRDGAMHLFYGLTAVGIVAGLAAAWVLQSRALAIIYIVTPGIYWFYSSSYKRVLVLGNLMMALLAGLIPMIIAIAEQAYLKTLYGEGVVYSTFTLAMYRWIGGFALFAFLLTWLREIVGDMQDEKGDRQLECHTLPVVLGFTWTKVVCYVLAALIMAFTIYAVYSMPFPFVWANPLFRMMCFVIVGLVCTLWLLTAARIPAEYRHAQILIRIVLFIGTLCAMFIPQML